MSRCQPAFQLDGIDYNAGNFVHADLDTETFHRMQEERGESILDRWAETRQIVSLLRRGYNWMKLN